MASLYRITDDIKSVYALCENAVDEDGNPRELTEEEQTQIKEWFGNSFEQFRSKFDSYCKLIKNFKTAAADVDGERKNFKAEMDRLSARAKAAENRAKSLQSMLHWAMDALGVPKFKTELFTAGIQQTAMQVEALAGESLSEVPEKYLKPRELDTAAIKQDIKDGILHVCEDNTVRRGMVSDDAGNFIKGIRAHRGESLVIR